MADLIDSLVGYVNDIKPYHTKIFGVEVEYVVQDSIDVEVHEDLQMKILMGLPVNEMKQLGEWSRDRWVPGIVGPRYDTGLNTWDLNSWDEGKIGDPISTTNPGVSIDRPNKAHDAILRSLYGDNSPIYDMYDDNSPYDDMFDNEPFRNAIQYPYPTGFMDIVYTKITEELQIHNNVVGGDVDDIHNFTLPLWDAELNGIDIVGVSPNVFYVRGNVEDVVNNISTFKIDPYDDMNVGWGTSSLDQYSWDGYSGTYTVINAIYEPQSDTTVIRVLEDTPLVSAGSELYGRILISLFDAGEWDGYSDTHVDQPDADLNASPDITECLEVVDGYTYDNNLSGGLDSTPWDEGTFILKGKSTLPENHTGFDDAFYDLDLWDAEPFFIRELFDAQGFDVGLLDSGSLVNFIDEGDVGTIVFSYDSVPRPSKYNNGTFGFSYSNPDEPKSTWLVNHNMGYHPIVRVYGDDNNPIEPLDIIHNTNMTLTVIFSSPTTGYLRIL